MRLLDSALCRPHTAGERRRGWVTRNIGPASVDPGLPSGISFAGETA
jgi:hypothetical protein